LIESGFLDLEVAVEDDVNAYMREVAECFGATTISSMNIS